MIEASPEKVRLRRALILSSLLGAAFYLGFSVWAGWSGVAHALGAVGVDGVALALVMSLVNYSLRFIRWQSYLAVLGHPVPVRASAAIYLSGFAFTTTPGKTGEMLRGLFLEQRGVPMLLTLAAFVSERLSDVFAVILIALPGLASLPRGLPLVAISLAGIGAIVVAVRYGDRIHDWCERRFRDRSGLRGVAVKGALLLREAQRCHAHGHPNFAALLSLLAWSAEAFAFWFILARLGFDAGLPFAAAVYALAVLAGALSFLPGGLGGTEAVMIAMLTLNGAPESLAVAATILVRLATLWFAVLLGLLVILIDGETLRVARAPS